MLDLAKLQQGFHDTAIKKGWWDTPRSFPECIALMHSELSEALEEYRNHKSEKEIYFNDKKPEGVPIELADCIIRILDCCGYFGIDMEAALSEKMKYNDTRPYRHGGKKL
jgi:NTP pyrophosphatase (non-canonical NTP hydrolase)